MPRRKMTDLRSSVRKGVRNYNTRLRNQLKKGRITLEEYDLAKQTTRGIKSMKYKELTEFESRLGVKETYKTIGESRISALKGAIDIIDRRIDLLSSKRNLKDRMTRQQLEIEKEEYEKLLKSVSRRQGIGRIRYDIRESAVYRSAKGTMDTYSEGEMNIHKDAILEALEKALDVSGVVGGDEVMEYLKSLDPQEFIDLYNEEPAIKNLLYGYGKYYESIISGDTDDYSNAVFSMIDNGQSLVDLIKKIKREREKV